MDLNVSPTLHLDIHIQGREREKMANYMNAGPTQVIKTYDAITKGGALRKYREDAATMNVAGWHVKQVDAPIDIGIGVMRKWAVTVIYERDNGQTVTVQAKKKPKPRPTPLPKVPAKALKRK